MASKGEAPWPLRRHAGLGCPSSPGRRPGVWAPKRTAEPAGPRPQLLGPPLARTAPAASPGEEEASSPFPWALPTPAACPCPTGAPGHVQSCAQRNGGGQSP